MFKIFVVLAASVLGTFSCRSTSFKGDDKQETAVPTPAATPAPLPTGCDPNLRKTNVVLNTTKILNGKPAQILSYDMSVVDCNGKPVPFKADKVLFDLDAEVTTPNQGVREQPYEVKTAEGTLIDKGNLKVVDGSDLFGNSGTSYYHHETERVIQVSNATTKITFNVDLSGFIHHNRAQTTTAPKEELIQTYLKFGDAQVVQQQVKFLN